MTKDFLDKIQKRVEKLLLMLSNDLQIASSDRCSEMTRLVGCWIMKEQPKCKTLILKGEFSDGLAHDILAIKSDKKLFLIDPTIWQIFPKSESIFVGSAGDIQEAIDLLNQKYKGSWKVSEDLIKCNDDFQKKLLKIIKNNGN